MRFRPYPGFTIFAAVSILLLCGLGTWQVQRLHWKLALIARIQHGLAAPAEYVEDIRELRGNLTTAVQSELDYRKVELKGVFLNRQEVLFFATGRDGAPEFHVLTPFAFNFEFAVDDNQGMTVSGEILVDRGRIPTELADPGKRKAGQLEGERTLVGVLRKPDAPNVFTPKADIAHRVTYTRDPNTVAVAFGLKPLLPMFLEADATPNPGGWPQGGQTVVDLPNNHLSYAVTWFGLALGLFGVWLAYHVSKGRFSLK